jgi:uncharacterized protein (TIGR00369 family)
VSETTIVSPDLIDRLREKLKQHPVQRFLDTRITDLQQDFCEMLLEFRHELDNGAGSIHGGVLAAVADTAVACALSTNFDGRMGFATSNLNIHFLRGAKTDITASAQIIKKGSKVCVGQVEMRDREGRLVATATCDFVLTTSHFPAAARPAEG